MSDVALLQNDLEMTHLEPKDKGPTTELSETPQITPRQEDVRPSHNTDLERLGMYEMTTTLQHPRLRRHAKLG